MWGAAVGVVLVGEGFDVFVGWVDIAFQGSGGAVSAFTFELEEGYSVLGCE